MIKVTLEDIENLRKEAELYGLRLHHHQLSDLINEFDERINYFERLKSVIMTRMQEDFRLTTSSMIKPFLRGLVKRLTDDVLEGVEEADTEIQDDCKVLEEGEFLEKESSDG